MFNPEAVLNISNKRVCVRAREARAYFMCVFDVVGSFRNVMELRGTRAGEDEALPPVEADHP